MTARLSKLIPIIAGYQSETGSTATDALLTELRELYGDALLATLFYGSCRRSHDHFNGLLDLYLIVDDYANAYPNRRLAWGNRLLPPNVFYHECGNGTRTVRAKYAILSLKDFKRGCSNWFHPYIWGRFCQPTAILDASSEQVRTALTRARAAAVIRFVDAVLPCLPATFTSAELWSRGLDLSYASELRPEKPGQGKKLYLADQDYYNRLTPVAVAAGRFPVSRNPGSETSYTARIPPAYREKARKAWKARSFQGKILSLLRLGKAFTTFHGGPDYIAWKIERHSGITMDPPPGRNHNLSSLGLALWRAWRKQAFR